MDRRAFLGSLATGSIVTTAGCANPLGAAPLRARDPQSLDDGLTKSIEFAHEGERRAALSLRQRPAQETPTDVFDFRLVCNHFYGEDGAETYEDSVAEWYQVDVRPRPGGGVLFNPGSLTDWPVTMERLGRGWTRISAELGGERGDSNVDLPMRIDPLGTQLDHVELRIELELSNGGLTGPTYRIDHETTFEPVVE